MPALLMRISRPPCCETSVSLTDRNDFSSVRSAVRYRAVCPSSFNFLSASAPFSALLAVEKQSLLYYSKCILFQDKKPLKFLTLNQWPLNLKIWEIPSSDWFYSCLACSAIRQFSKMTKRETVLFVCLRFTHRFHRLCSQDAPYTVFLLFQIRCPD